MPLRYVVMAVGLIIVARPAHLRAQFKEQLRDQVIQIKHDTAEDHLNKPKARIEPVKEITPEIGVGRVYAVKSDWMEQHEAEVQVSARYTAIVDNPAHIEEHKLAPIPDLILNNGWLYVGGNKPVAGTSAVVAQAQGSTVALEIITNEAGTFHRVYYLEGDPDKYVWVSPVPANAGPPAVLTIGSYVDAKVRDENNQPVFHWVQNANSVTHRPRPDIATTGQYEVWAARVKAAMDERFFAKKKK